jgi:Family of unknown function (DUF6011)
MPLDETPGSITERQANYIAALVAKKDLNGNSRYTPTPEQRVYLEAGNYTAMSKAQASKAIEKLLELNDKPIPATIEEAVEQAEQTGEPLFTLTPSDEPPPVPVSETRAADYEQPTLRETQAARLTELEQQVDEGYYFIVNPNLVARGLASDRNHGERFYHVSKGKEGTPWEGYTFVESRGGDFLYKVRSMDERIAILEEIAKDPVTAMNEYGMRLGVCGCCGRTLTARDSRLRGIGPICAAKLMMQDAQATDEQLDMLRQLGLKKD